MDVAPSPGRRSVLSDFSLGRELGRGASSVVHLARQQSLDRDVALKRLLRSLSSDQDASARLRREAQVVARLDHPRIVRLYDLMEDGADVVLVMEYVPGPTVRALTASSSPSPGQALAVVSDVAEALEHAAEKGVVHRDVKPPNVFVTASGRCTLGDFGLARLEGDRSLFLSNDGSLRGTPLYMAPEQLRGLPLAPASDVYALSVMALELLSGGHPFAGLTARGAIEAHLDGGAVGAAKRSQLPRGIVAVLCDGLAPDGRDRPAAREFAEGLRHAAPRAWLRSPSAEHTAKAPTPQSSGAAPTVPADRDGLWAEGERGGWTILAVDTATWLGTPDSDTHRSGLLGHAVAPAESGEQDFAPSTGTTNANAGSPIAIDDGWIRHAASDIGPRSGRSNVAWPLILAAFVVGFALVFAALEFLRH